MPLFYLILKFFLVAMMTTKVTTIGNVPLKIKCFQISFLPLLPLNFFSIDTRVFSSSEGRALLPENILSTKTSYFFYGHSAKEKSSVWYF